MLGRRLGRWRGLRREVALADYLHAEGAAGLEKALDRVCVEATDCVLADRNILILSDRAVSADRTPIPALLATAAVHHHLHDCIG